MKIFDALFPRTCFKCGEEGSLFCLSCHTATSFENPPFAYANPIVRQLICAWKYNGDAEAFKIIHRLLLPRLSSLRSIIADRQIEAVVPVPLSSWKERWRGFSQSRDLANFIGAELKLPVIDGLNRKHRWQAQANLSHGVRKLALANSPYFLKIGIVMPSRILLIDDVETTGATMNAVEEVLLKGGVELVVRWSLAEGR